jgi:hypothetical protein
MNEHMPFGFMDVILLHGGHQHVLAEGSENENTNTI